MSDDKPRINRLTKILTQLQSKKMLTAREIAEKHQISIRTVYRDIKTLEQSGIPIITVEGKGYSIMKGFNLPPVSFTEDEAIAMVTAEQLIIKNKDKSLVDQYKSAITKIKSVLRMDQKSKTETISDRIQVRNNLSGEQTSNYLIQLQSCIANYQLIEIDYLSLSNNKSTRKIEPFAIFTTNNNWLLIAFCRNKNEFRTFRLDCIENLRPQSENFEPHKLTMEQYFEACRKKWSTTPDTPLSLDESTFASNQK